MTLDIIEPELEQAVATLLADSVVSRLFTEIDKLRNAATVDEAWFKTVLDVLQFCGSIETGFGHGKAYLLAVIKPRWDDLPFNVRKQFGLDFMNFARSVTGKEVSTINNYINTANVWFIDRRQPNGPVKIIERDIEGRPILKPDGTPNFKETEFNPYQVDMSKLLAVNSRAAKGEMSDRLWEMLTDPVYTCEDVQREHASTKIGGILPDSYFSLIGPGIFYQSGPEIECIAEALNWEEYETKPQVKEGIDKLLRALHITPDEDIIYNMKKSVSAYGTIQ